MSSRRLALAVMVLAAGVLRAQSSDPRERWLMQNYRFTGPPPPGTPTPLEPLIAQLQNIQNFTMAILRKADFYEDWWTALYAAQQAAENAQLIDAYIGRFQVLPPIGPVAPVQAAPKPTIYLIAHKDGDIHAATSYWSDGRMLHCITLEGAHEQIRLDLVDWKLSSDLNRQRNLDFPIPEAKASSY
jgi:hypothetical protein